MAKVAVTVLPCLAPRKEANSDDIEKERCDSKRALMLT
jgi:hypothetical protein